MNDNIIQLDKNSFVLTPNNDRVSAFGNAKPGNIGTDFRPMGVYNDNYIGYDLNGIRNANQSNWNRFGYVAANFVPNFLIGIGEGLGSLGYPIFGFNSDYGRAMDKLTSMRNPITSDDFMLNYKDPSKPYDMSDPSTYFSMGAGLAESIASFAVTGNIFAGGISALEPFVAKAVTNTIKSAKYVSTFGKTAELAPNTSRNILNAMRYAKQGTQALAMANSEGTMIGNDVYNQGLMHYSKPIIDKLYKQKLQDYINQSVSMNPDMPFDANQIPSTIKQMLMEQAGREGKIEANKIYGKELGKAAFVTSVTNALIGSVLEWTAAGLFINKNPNLNKAVLRNANGERTGVSNALHGVKDATEGAAKLSTMTPIVNKINAFGMYMSQGGQEFLEEAWMNNTAEWLGTKYLGINDKDYKDFIFSTKSLIDGTLGFIGGFGQTALTNVGTKYMDGKRTGENGEDLGRMSRNVYNDYLYNNSTVRQLENAKNDLTEFGAIELKLNNLYEQKNNLSKDDALGHRRLQPEIDAAKDELFNLSKRRTIRDGNGDLLLSFYENILDLDNTKSTKDEQGNDTGKSEAMIAGFASELNDDNYKQRAIEAINGIKEAQQIYADAQLNYNVDGHDYTGYGESILNYHLLTNDVKNSVNKFTEAYHKRETELNNVVQNMNMGNISNYIEVLKTNRLQKAELQSLEDALKLHKKELSDYNKKVANSKETDDDYLYLQAKKDVFIDVATKKIDDTTNKISEAKKSLSDYANVKKQAFNDYLLQDKTYFEEQQKIDKHKIDIQTSKDNIELERSKKGKFINNAQSEAVLDVEGNATADKNIKEETTKIKQAEQAIKDSKKIQLDRATKGKEKLKQNINNLNLYIDSSVIAKQQVNQVSQGLAKLQQEMLDLQSHKGKQQYRENWLNHKNYINTLYSKYFNIQEDNNVTDSQEEVEPVVTPEEQKEVVNVAQNTTVNKVLSVVDKIAKDNNITTVEAIEKIRNESIIVDLNGKPIVGNLVDAISIINNIKDNKVTLTKDDINKINALLEVYNVIDGNLQKTFKITLRELLDVLNATDNVEFVDIARLLSNSIHEYNEYTIKVNTKKFTGDKHPTLHDIIREGINAINNLSTRIDNFELSPVLLELNNTLGDIVVQHNNYTEVLNKYIELFNKQQTTTKNNTTTNNTEETKTEEKDTRTSQEILFDTAISDLETQLALRNGSIMKMLNSEVIKFFDNTVSPDDEIELNKITNEQLKINSLNDVVTIKKLLDKFNDKGAKNYLLAKLLLANGQLFYKSNIEVVENDKIDGSTRIFDVVAQITKNGEVAQENEKVLNNIKSLEIGETIIPIITRKLNGKGKITINNVEIDTPNHVKIIEDAGKTVADDDVTLLDSKGNIVGSIQTKQYQASALAFGKALVKIATNEDSKLNDIKKALNDLLYRIGNTKNKEDSSTATTEYTNIAKELEATGKLTINGITIEIDRESLKELQKYYTKNVATNATKVLEHLVRLLNRHKNNEMSLTESLQRWVDVMNNDIKINEVLRKSVKDGKRKFKVVSKSTGSIEIGEQTKLGQHIKVTFEEAKSTNFLVTKNNTGTIVNAITGITVDNSIIKHLNKGQLVILSNNTLNGKEVPISIIQKNLSEKSINHVITLFKQLAEEYKTNGRNKTKSAFGYNNISNKIEGFIQKTYKGVKVFNIDTSTGNIRINGKTTYDLNDATQVEALKKVLATLQRNINFDLLINNKDYFNSIMDSDDIVTNIKPLMIDGKVVSLTQPNGKVPFGIKIEEDSNTVDNSTTKTDNDIFSKGDDKSTKVESDAKSDTKEQQRIDIENRKQSELSKFENRRANTMVKFNPDGENTELTEGELEDANLILDKLIEKGKSVDEIIKALHNRGYYHELNNSATAFREFIKARIDGTNTSKINGSFLQDIIDKYDAELKALEEQTSTDTQSPVEKEYTSSSDNTIIGLDEDIDEDINEINPYIIYDKTNSDTGIKLLNNIVRDNNTMTSDKVIFNYIDSHFADNTTSELHKILDLLYKFKYNVKVVDSIAIYNPTAKEGTYMYWNGTEIVLGKEEIVNNNSSDFIYRFLHEVIHGVNNEEMKDTNSLLFKTTQQELAKAIKLIGTYDTEGNLITTNDYYGLTNEKEFLSEIFTNAKFRELLINAETTGSLNMIQRIINNIIKFITGNTIWNDDNLNLKTINDLQSYKLLTKLIDYKINNNDIYSKNIKNNTIDRINVPLFDYNNNNEIKYSLDAVNVLQSDKGKQIFDKGIKNNWSIDKILNELGLPKAEKQLIINIGITDREELIVELATKYSYNVEVNIGLTPMVNGSHYVENLSNNEFENEIGWKVTNKDTNATIGVYPTEEEAWEIANKRDGSSYYSNLTVAGGTNYTENEISTPLITPSIKGHAQFSTDNGIGWFRSDEQVINGTIYNFESNDSADNIEYIDEEGFPVYKSFPKTIGGDTTKTRRILEIQSDLFQKGRDKENLDKGIYKETIIRDFTNDFKIEEGNNISYRIESAFETGESNLNERIGYIAEVKTQKEVEKIANDYDNQVTITKIEKDNTHNQFLQLLNKDNNWVTFFIKSIIQDSAKKGYESVLFPRGETAAKIEGHETLTQRLNELDIAINNPNKYKSYIQEYGEFVWRITGNIGGEYIESYSEQDFIETLNKEKQELKSQGIAKLAPIEHFYENTVTNILKKITPIEEVTDEFGNKWSKVTIVKDINLSEIATQQEIEEQRKHCNK